MSAEELVDVVDEQDCVVGQATRGEIRRLNLRHRCVYVLVFNSMGQLFVHRRTESKDIFPAHWDIAVGGVVGAGEAYDNAAHRELHEELGLHGLSLRRLFSIRYEDQATRALGMVYSCTADGPLHLQTSEVAASEWMDLDVLLERTQSDPFCPDGLEVLRVYLSRLDAARNRQ
jgi:isopentenyldiphosphate isomerase